MPTSNTRSCVLVDVDRVFFMQIVRWRIASERYHLPAAATECEGTAKPFTTRLYSFGSFGKSELVAAGAGKWYWYSRSNSLARTNFLRYRRAAEVRR